MANKRTKKTIKSHWFVRGSLCIPQSKSIEKQAVAEATSRRQHKENASSWRPLTKLILTHCKTWKKGEITSEIDNKGMLCRIGIASSNVRLEWDNSSLFSPKSQNPRPDSYIFGPTFQIPVKSAMSLRARREEERQRKLNDELDEEEKRYNAQKERIYAPVVWRRLGSGIRIQDLKSNYYDRVLQIIQVGSSTWENALSPALPFRNAISKRRCWAATATSLETPTRSSLSSTTYCLTWRTGARLLD